MKVKVGHRLQVIREERKLTQAEMAQLLNVAPTSYSRIERGEASVAFEDLARYADVLQVPVTDFLPDTFAFNNHNNGKVGVVFGTINSYNNYSDSQESAELRHQVELLTLKLAHAEEKAKMLAEQVAQLSRLLPPGSATKD